MSITKLEIADSNLPEYRKLTENTPSAAAAPAKSAETPAASRAELEEAVEKLNALVSRATTILFSLDDESGKTIIRVVDTETQTVLRQIPNEEALAMSRNLDRLQGLVLRQQA
jgi:flagellar protein FlaG